MQELLSWPVLVSSVIALVTLGFGVLTLPKQPEYSVAKGCFCIAAAYACIKVFMWGITTSASTAVRLLMCFFLFGGIGLLMMEAVRLVNNRQKDAHPAMASSPTTPDVLPQHSNEQKHKETTPLVKPPEQKEEKPEPQTAREEPPLPIQRLFHSVEKISSTREDLPYGLSITIQTTASLNPVHIAVICDGPIGDANVQFSPTPGASVSVSNMFSKFQRIDGHVYEFSFENPPLTPKRPLEVKLYSIRNIRVVAVKQLD